MRQEVEREAVMDQHRESATDERSINGADAGIGGQDIFCGVIFMIIFVSITIILQLCYGRQLHRLVGYGKPCCGLKPNVVESFPVISYSADEEVVAQCVVCLSKFEEGENLRRLPRCEHCFHVECIDLWFCSHSTCPICRCQYREDMMCGGDPSHCHQSSISSLELAAIDWPMDTGAPS